MWILCIALAILPLFGCGTENSASSTRSLERLLVGTWVIPNTDFVTEEFEDWVSIIFEADGTFTAPWGLAGRLVREYQGSYWQSGNYIGTRGVAPGEPGVLLKFARITSLEWTGEPVPGMGIEITEIKDEYITDQLGFGPLRDVPSGKVQDILNRLNKTSPPADVLGPSRTYLKIERRPFQPTNFGS